jgi:hypothetical protein
LNRKLSRIALFATLAGALAGCSSGPTVGGGPNRSGSSSGSGSGISGSGGSSGSGSGSSSGSGSGISGSGGSSGSGSGSSSGSGSGISGSGGTSGSGSSGTSSGLSISGGSSGSGAPCGSPNSPSLFRNWLVTNAAGNVFNELTLNPDGTYQITILITTSTVTGDEYIQKGTFALNGGTITLTPTEASCPTALIPSSLTYDFDGAALSVTDSSGTKTNYAATSSAVPGPAGLTLVVGCSLSQGAPWMPEPMTGSPPTGSPVVQPSVFGNWLITNAAGNVFNELTLNPDGTYQITILITTSTVTGDEYIQKGCFALNGAAITFTATEASCPKPVPIYSDAYGFNGAGLGVVDSAGTGTVYLRTGSAVPGPAGLTLVIGCSLTTPGPWMPEPLAPVSN